MNEILSGRRGDLLWERRHLVTMPLVVIEVGGMQSSEIVLSDTKPETEWVRGRALQKVSPQYNHGRLQSKLAAALDGWAGNLGVVATEWRFRIEPPGEARRPVVPDIAYVAAAQLRSLTLEDVQIPTFPPTVAFEVLSPDDLRADVDSKIDVYLRAGTRLVVIVDPIRRAIELHESETLSALGVDDVLMHAELPGFRLEIGAYFEAALRLID